jgi:hypothetical protein
MSRVKQYWLELIYIKLRYSSCNAHRHTLAYENHTSSLMMALVRRNMYERLTRHHNKVIIFMHLFVSIRIYPILPISLVFQAGSFLHIVPENPWVRFFLPMHVILPTNLTFLHLMTLITTIFIAQFFRPAVVSLLGPSLSKYLLTHSGKPVPIDPRILTCSLAF